MESLAKIGVARSHLRLTVSNVVGALVMSEDYCNCSSQEIPAVKVAWYLQGDPQSYFRCNHSNEDRQPISCGIDFKAQLFKSSQYSEDKPDNNDGDNGTKPDDKDGNWLMADPCAPMYSKDLKLPMLSDKLSSSEKPSVSSPFTFSNDDGRYSVIVVLPKLIWFKCSIFSNLSGNLSRFKHPYAESAIRDFNLQMLVETLVALCTYLYVGV